MHTMSQMMSIVKRNVWARQIQPFDVYLRCEALSQPFDNPLGGCWPLWGKPCIFCTSYLGQHTQMLIVTQPLNPFKRNKHQITEIGKLNVKSMIFCPASCWQWFTGKKC
uniref:Uncharacterized protein n=1 Tax=Eutreptiella gymnastica TaxID=73025 RepID=A0A7S1JD03_9EUGL